MAEDNDNDNDYYYHSSIVNVFDISNFYFSKLLRCLMFENHLQVKMHRYYYNQKNNMII